MRRIFRRVFLLGAGLGFFLTGAPEGLKGDVMQVGKEFRGVSIRDLPEDQLEAVPGPLPGRVGLFAAENPVVLELESEERLETRGSVRIWVRTDRPYRTGIAAATSFDQPILRAPDLFELSFLVRNHVVGPRWLWRGGDMPNNLTNWIPGIPGPVWIHLAYEWDSEQGYFMGYINGTALRLSGVREASWEMPSFPDLKLTLGRFAVSGLDVRAELIDEDELAREVTDLYAGSMDGLIGARSLGSAAMDERKGELLYENPLSRQEDIAGWVAEGPADLSFQDGWMLMESGRPDGPEGHIVVWCDEDFPESYIAEWEIRPVSEDGLCIVFFSAKGRRGEDVFDPALERREGIFSRYHSGDLNSYHISYYANSPRAPGRVTSNMRKNHGFYLVANGPPGIAPGSTGVHTVSLMKDGPHIQLAVDGELIIEFFDDGETYGPVLGGGKLGLRQMQWTEAEYRNFRVYSVAR